MNYANAIAQVQDGKRVTRKAWGGLGRFLQSRGQDVLLYDNPTDWERREGSVGFYAFGAADLYQPTPEDENADDWLAIGRRHPDHPDLPLSDLPPPEWVAAFTTPDPTPSDEPNPVKNN